MKLIQSLMSTVGVCAALLGMASTAQAGLEDIVGRMLGTIKPQTTVVLLDRSASIALEDKALYLASLDGVSESLVAGDRVMLARIGDRARSGFRVEQDVTVERTGKRLNDREAVDKAKLILKAYAADFVGSNDQNPAKHTLILEAISAAAEAYGAAPREGAHLVLLTDGIEESNLANFKHGRMDEAAITAILKRIQLSGLLPNLRGVNVYLVGAGGSNYAEIERFWRRYFAKTGATLKSYGRLALRRHQD